MSTVIECWDEFYDRFVREVLAQDYHTIEAVKSLFVKVMSRAPRSEYSEREKFVAQLLLNGIDKGSGDEKR